jgi:hypothetical protein
MVMEDLKAALLRDRLAAFVRLKGGFPIPLAGAIYWAALGLAGYRLSPGDWGLIAFVFSGSIFPLALLMAKLFGNAFMKDRTAAGDVIIYAFVSMLLFWPIAVAALWQAVQLVPLILAIGMSQHWPVIGWSYGKPGIYSAHAVVRAIGAFIIWVWLPEGRFTLIPFWVAATYLVTVAAILVAAKRQAAEAAAAA